MKIVALTRLHYGADYLDAVIRSTEGFAEQHIIVYTPVPTFGHATSLPCPDSREELLAIAQKAAGERLVWIEDVPSVGVGFREVKGIDILLELDGDEVIHQNLLADILPRYMRGELTCKQYRLPMVHHWRSFRYVCTDQQWPIRLYLPHALEDDTRYYPRVGSYIHHFGYARRLVDMQYKWAISVHKPEMRPEWWAEVYHAFPDRLEDLHPVINEGWWNAEPFEDGDLPAALVNHPYRDLEVIE